TPLPPERAKGGPPADARYNMTHELLIKQQQFNDALNQSLGLTLLASVAGNSREAAGPFFDPLGQPTSQTVIPGQKFSVNLHIADQGTQPIKLTGTQLISHAGPGWTFSKSDSKPDTHTTLTAGQATAKTIAAPLPAAAEITRPYFFRSNLEKSYYDIGNPAYAG